MKYIRTKDGVKPICGENHITNTVSYYNSRGRLSSAKVDDSRIADTIKELCDEFVFKPVGLKCKPSLLGIRGKPISNKNWDISVKRVLKNHDNLYGAIWVDCNLIKVAKMNDKGILELL